MKKQSPRKKKKKRIKKTATAVKKNGAVNSDKKPLKKDPVNKKPVQNTPKKAIEKKGDEGVSIFKSIGKAGQFLRESKNELKRVKWPTRKELLASTAVVIVFSLIVSFFLGLIDFGLIKIIKSIVG
ncbi:MAG: preprotein translocase subunit SecE [Deltaproteobacteria bacterium]|nr:preprotein translocase subunit SecE [Deltaproteobacteria bacterium]MBW2118717.1 preprotein translocase subunit SecE [Deltaproteobacteria bacterium]MBW2344312.1 preprotein translocase subunit SecE [Deltaproteobacteria bacterium]